MSDVANPSAEATQQAATAPATPPPTSEDAAAKLVQGMLEGEPTRPTPEPAKDDAEANQIEEPTDETDTGTEAEAAEPDDDDLGEEADADDDAEVLDDDDEVLDDPDEEPEQLHTVTIDGKEEQVTLKEALQGYQRQSDYQRKTAALAEERQTHETSVTEAKAALNERFELADGLLSEALQTLGAVAPPNPDLLDETKDIFDPDQYQLEEARFRKAQADIQKITGRVQEGRARLTQAQQAERAALTKAEADKLRKQWPALDRAVKAGDNSMRKKLMGQVKNYAIGLGFSEAQIDSIVDHRQVLILRKAMFYDRKLADGKVGLKKVKAAPKMTGKKPNAAADRGTSASQKRQQSRQTLRKVGTKDAAAAYVQSLFD